MVNWKTVLDFTQTRLPTLRLAVGIDPGRQRCGCVVISLEPLLGVFLAKRLSNVELCELLWELEPEFIFIEGFRLYPWIAKDKRWDYFPEIRIIGAVEEIARVCSLKMVEIPPSQSKNNVPDKLLYLLGTWARCHHTTDAFRVFWTVVLDQLELEVQNE